MITDTEPYLRPEDIVDDETVTAVVVAACHTHISDLALMKQDLIQVHALIHAMGEDESDMHQECLDKMKLLQSQIDRGLKAVWS